MINKAISICYAALIITVSFLSPAYAACNDDIDSCGGFNTRRFSAPLCVVTKDIKADCNHLIRTTYPDACVGIVDYREEMRQLVIAISIYGKKYNSRFIVIPQNGLELITKDGSLDSDIQYDYIKAITAIGVESLFYGYAHDNRQTPHTANRYMLDLCRLYKKNGVQPLIIDYCSSTKYINRSYALNESNGFISFAADIRNLTDIPQYPLAPFNVHSGNVYTVSEAKNFLYLINSEGFASKRHFIDTVKKTDYDVIIMDLFHFGIPYNAPEIAELKVKHNGGKRLVICYMSIGEAENYRYYWHTEWNTKKPDWLMKENPLWKGNYLVQYWHPEWQHIITGMPSSYQQKILEAGFDGVYLDIIDAFEYFEKK